MISHVDMFVHRGNWAKLLGRRALDASGLRALPPSADAIMRRYGFKTCAIVGRGLHSSTVRLNFRASCGIGGASGSCLGVV